MAPGRSNGVGASRTSLRTAAAKALPKPKPTGDPCLDEENMGNFRIFQTVVDELASDASHVVPAFNLVQDRKSQKALTASRVTSETFTNVTTFASLPDDFKLTWIVQINLKTKVPAPLLHKEVMKECMVKRHKDCGSPLATFKARGGLKGDELDLEAGGSYALKYDGDTVVGVKHRSGVEGAIKKGNGFNREWDLVANHDCYGAHLVLPPGPPHPLRVYFAKGKGPNAFKTYMGKPKELVSDAQAIFDAWETRKIEAKGGAAGETDAAIKKVKDARKRKKTAVLDKARAAGKASMAAKTKKVTIKLKK